MQNTAFRLAEGLELEPIEEAALRRLCEWQLRHEAPLPIAPDDAAVAIGMELDLEAVCCMLDRFFDNGPEGWSCSGIDAILKGHYERLEHEVDQRARLFQALADLGIDAKPDATTAELAGLIIEHADNPISHAHEYGIEPNRMFFLESCAKVMQREIDSLRAQLEARNPSVMTRIKRLFARR